MLVAGVDSSTQSTKVLLCRAEDGTVVGQASAPHPDGTECAPELWWQALGAAGGGLADQADADSRESIGRLSRSLIRSSPSADGSIESAAACSARRRASS